MSIVSDQIAKETAALTRVVPAPTGDLGFGSDLSCTDDITQDAAEIAGDTPIAVAQAAYRRMRTPRGSLPDDVDYGMDVAGYLNRGVTSQALLEIPGEVKSELEKDDRINPESLEVTMVQSADLHSFTLDVRGETQDGPFDLTLSVTSAGVVLDAINGAS